MSDADSKYNHKKLSKIKANCLKLGNTLIAKILQTWDFKKMEILVELMHQNPS